MIEKIKTNTKHILNNKRIFIFINTVNTGLRYTSNY